ncbi:MAG: flagellar motor switch protein FliM, partial [Gemmobacter sp.]
MSAILRRKIAASRPPSHVRQGALQLLPLSVARTARAGLSLDITCSDAGSDRVTLAELLEMPDERALILLLEGPGGSGGMLAMCPSMLAALIEVQTLGCVTAQP